MKIFINDKPVMISSLQSPLNSRDYNVLNSADGINSKQLVGNVLIYESTLSQLERFLKLTEVKKLKKLESITFQVPDVGAAKQFVKDHFKIIKAAGGLVVDGEKVLMIYRLKKWDLPKGKLKKKEDTEKGAKREVEEECNIKVEIKNKIGSTWHSYTQNGKRILKRTVWYEMSCVDQTHMKPQLKEFIEEVKWVDKKDVKKLLKTSYKSIEEVFRKYSKSYIS